MKWSVLNVLCLFTWCVVQISAQLDVNVKLLRNELTPPPQDWWVTASLYQIYPRSFRDTNGDGIGDLNGVTERLSYFKEIGIKGVWLSPIYKSPMADFGYDISDFFDIQPEYGSLKDFDALIAKAKEIGVKIILDFVPNHSSDENPWFINSVNRVAGYEDFYVWHPGYANPNNATVRLPPSNWRSVFRGSAWQFNEKRGEFYLHQFLSKQPDLNYRNPAVVAMMKSVLTFWMDRGVSGFRCDAVPTLFEVQPDVNGRYPDEPRSGYSNDTDAYEYLSHIYTLDQNETFDMMYQWREVLEQHKREHGGDSRILLAETYSALDDVMRFYGDGQRDGAHIPFNFLFITQLHYDSNAMDFKRVIAEWMNKMPAGRTANWVLGNHDQNRVGTRMGAERIDAMNMIMMSLPGVSVTYYGEEIGMLDKWLSWNDTVDPAACRTNPSIYEYFSRDPERTPFQWDSSLSAGFSSSAKTWLPVGDDYKSVNVKSESSEKKSHFNVYRYLIQYRDFPTMKFGTLTTKALTPNVLMIMREYLENPTFVVLANIGVATETVSLELFRLPDELEVVIAGALSSRKRGDIVAKKQIVLSPNESLWMMATPNHYYHYVLIN